MSSNNDVVTFKSLGVQGTHGKKFPKVSQTSFTGIVHLRFFIGPQIQLSLNLYRL